MVLSKENWLAVFAAIAYTESRMPRVYTSRTADFLPLKLFELDRAGIVPFTARGLRARDLEGNATASGSLNVSRSLQDGQVPSNTYTRWECSPGSVRPPEWVEPLIAEVRAAVAVLRVRSTTSGAHRGHISARSVRKR